MTYALAVWLGSTVAVALDAVVFIPAILVGLIAPSWRARLAGWFIALVAVLAIKVPIMQRVAAELGNPPWPLWQTALVYGTAIGVIIALSGGLISLVRPTSGA